MSRSNLILVFFAAAARAQTPGVPHGGGPCATDDDCSLGGECAGTPARCACDAWFTGPTCALLNLQAPADTAQGTCGPSFDNYHSWGGRTIFDAADGKYHAYISFLCKHNNLGAWTTQSASAHFVAASPAGEYAWGPEQCTPDGVCTPAIIPWSHNTVALADASFPADARYQIFHVGDGVVPAAKWAPCWNASEAGPHWAPPAKPAPLDAAGWSVGAVAPNPGNTAYVTAAPTASGPWTRELDNAGVTINFTGSWTAALAGNPAPLVMPDGSVNLYFTATPCPPNSGAKAPNCIAVATSTTGSLGPYQMHAAKRPITSPESEDPSTFRDPRGNYHLLTNVNTYHARCAQGVECGGHAWSRDGFVFSNLTVGAFGPYITFANGSGWANAYVERPLVTQAPDGTPLAFYVGMGRTGYGDSCNWPQLFCTGAAGEACGPTLTPPPPPSPSPPPPPPAGGNNWGCGVAVGDCEAAASVWRFSGDGPLRLAATSPAHAGTPLAVNFDCDRAAPGTPVWALGGASGSEAPRVTLAGGALRVAGGAACLGTSASPARPCGPQQKWPLAGAVAVVDCADASASGWAVEPA